MSSNARSCAGAAAADEGAKAFSDVTAEFRCFRVTVLLARAGAAPEADADAELVLLFVAIQSIFSLKNFKNRIP
jgi:hypothetical protein